MTVSFTIPGTPKAKARHRTVCLLRCPACQRQTMGPHWECPHCGHKGLFFVKNENYADTDQKNAEKFSAMCAAQGMVGSEKFIGPTAVDCIAYFEIPKSRKKLNEGDWHTQRPDL
jgi:hypothetical protein